MKQSAWWILGLSLAGALAGAASLGVMAVLGPRVMVVAAVQREIIQAVIVSGRVLPPARVSVGSMVAGVVTAVAVKEGSHVKPGDLLVQLDDSEASAAVRAAQAGLQEAEARLEQLSGVTAPVDRAAHRQADANLAFAQLGYQRQSSLARQGGATLAQVDEARRALTVAEGQHDASAAQVSGSGKRGAAHRLAAATCAQAAANLAQAEVRKAQSRLLAATPALVLTRSVEPGDLVQPGRVLLTLAKDGATQLSVLPDEKNLATLRLGQPALASADAFAQRSFEARVAYIAPSVDPLRGSVEVRLDVAQPPLYLRPDMTVSVNIEVGRRAAALVVPEASVQDLTAPRPWLWLLRGRRVEHQTVELGLRGAGSVEIRSGVGLGDRIAVPGASVLSAHQRVRAVARVGG